MTSISERKKAEHRKLLKRLQNITEKAVKNLEAKVDSGKSIRDEEWRILKKGPDLFRDYELAIQESLEEEKGLPPGRLKEISDRLEWRENLGKEEDILEAMEYYRCSECLELHKKGEQCIFMEYSKLVKSNEESENIEDKEDDSKEES